MKGGKRRKTWRQRQAKRRRREGGENGIESIGRGGRRRKIIGGK